MDITRAAIDKNRITLVITTLLVLSGALAFMNLPKAHGELAQLFNLSGLFEGK